MEWLDKMKFKQLALRFRNKWNKNELDFVFSTLRKGQTAFDIGAHKGVYTYFMEQIVGNEGKVHSFEPQKSLCEHILKFKDLLHWKNVTVQHLAMSETKGITSLNIPAHKGKADTESATILVHKERTLYKSETVETETLDNYCQLHKIKPDFLKIDVEGHELQVLKGGKEIIKSCLPGILIEIEARHCGKEQGYETLQFLTNMGYLGWFLFNGQKTPIENFNFDIHQADKHHYTNNFMFVKG